MRMILPADYEMMTWLGRGPHENYADRKNSAAIGVYTASVWEQYHPYVRAQETANKCDVRWVALRSQSGEGLLVTGEEPLSISAWNFPLEDHRLSPIQRRASSWRKHRKTRSGMAEHRSHANGSRWR